MVCLGQASLDLLGVVPHWPDEDSKCELDSLTIQGGGPAATAAVTIKRLGLNSALIAAVGDDWPGRFIIDGLIQEQVDVTGVVTISGARSQVAFIAISPGARRTIFWHSGEHTELPADQINMDIISRGDLLHVDGLKLSACLAAADQAQAMGTPIVYDAGTLRPGCLELVAKTTYLIASEKFFRQFQPDGDLKAGLVRLQTLGPAQVVITLGARGSQGFDGRACHYQPAFPVAAVDSTGAGDVYHGAYIYGILAGWDLPTCMRLASAVAAIKCTRIGGRTGIPTLDQVWEFLGENETS